MTEPDPIVALHDVSVRYGEKRALQGISLGVRGGQLCAIIGANGCGKSSLLKLLAGRLAPAAGLVRFSPNLGTTVQARNRAIGYAAQAPELDPEMTGREHLDLFAALCRIPKATRGERVVQVSERLGLTPFLDQRVEQCSGGIRQRLHLALSLLHAPLLWLLDEPFSGLDPEAQGLLWESLAQHAQQGGAALVVSHDLAHTAARADHVLVLEAGKLLTSDTPHALTLAHGSLQQAFESLTGRRARELAPLARRGRGPHA